MFTDTAKIFIRSGRGGDGHVSFRREKYVPAGGPDGGDGGKGGDLIFEVDTGLNTLTDFRHKRKYAAEDGEPGGKKRCHGKNGKDCVIKVPSGTIIREAESGKIIADMSYDNKRMVVLKGGNGGNGNMHYATSTMQIPKYAQPGQDALELEVILELKSIADVGLVGFPNVGKSTFLSKVTNASPKIANYHFTTIDPNLGVVDLDGVDGFIIADIPGIIEGAADGLGLGHKFLRHIERTKVFIHIVDAASVEGRDPIEDIKAINAELRKYDADLSKRPQVIAANKIDCFYDDSQKEVIQKIKEAFAEENIEVFPISAVTGEGIKELLYHVKSLLDNSVQEDVVFENEFDVSVLNRIEDGINTFVDDEGVYHVEGPKIEKMLGYTNLDDEKGFTFFQKFMKDNGILSPDDLRADRR